MVCPLASHAVTSEDIREGDKNRGTRKNMREIFVCNQNKVGELNSPVLHSERSTPDFPTDSPLHNLSPLQGDWLGRIRSHPLTTPPTTTFRLPSPTPQHTPPPLDSTTRETNVIIATQRSQQNSYSTWFSPRDAKSLFA